MSDSFLFETHVPIKTHHVGSSVAFLCLKERRVQNLVCRGFVCVNKSLQSEKGGNVLEKYGKAWNSKARAVLARGENPCPPFSLTKPVRVHPV